MSTQEQDVVKLQTLILEICTSLLDASFVNYGVMRFYNDESFTQVVHCCSQCILSIPVGRLNSYPSLRYSYCFTLRALVTHDDGLGFLLFSSRYKVRILRKLCFLLNEGFPLEVSQASVGICTVLKLAYRSLRTIKIMKYKESWSIAREEYHAKNLQSELSALRSLQENCDLANMNWTPD
jgi:hypothetical protein